MSRHRARIGLFEVATAFSLSRPAVARSSSKWSPIEPAAFWGGFGQEGPELSGAAVGVLQGLVDQSREVFHRGFEFASFATDARREDVERLTPPFDLPVDVVVRDPEVPGGFGQPHADAVPRRWRSRRRRRASFRRTDASHRSDGRPRRPLCRNPRPRPLSASSAEWRFAPAVSTKPTRAWLETSRRPMRPVNPSSSSRLVLDSSASERLAPTSSALRRPSLD